MNETSDDGASAKRVRELIAAGEREAAELTDASTFAKPPPDAIPGYEITGEIGRGGMGVVYKALQVSTKRVVALKVMLAGLFASRSVQRRFQREVELTARFKHEGIVRILESGFTSTGQQYYAMDYVCGLQLDRWIATNKPDVRTTLRLFANICDAVEHAHRHSVVHRDLKPANILIDADGQPHILDFGLSKATDGTAEGTLAMTASVPGHVVGTLRYLSPEQAAGASGVIDARTDVYALGVTLFEALTGGLPHSSEGHPSEVMERIKKEPPALPSSLSKRVDRELERIILKALEKESDQRYSSVATLREDINRYLGGEPILARRTSSFYVLRKKLVRQRMRIAIAGLALVLGLAGLWGGTWWSNFLIERQQARELDSAHHTALRTLIDLEGGTALAQDLHAAAMANLDRHPKLPEARLVWARTRYRLAQQSGVPSLSNQSFDILRQGIEDGCAPWACLALLAEMHAAAGDPRAVEMKAQADRETPNTAEGWYIRSFATLDLHAARKHAEHAVQLAAQHVLAWERLAYLCLHTGDTDRAVEASQQVIALGGSTCNWLLFQSRALAQARQYEEAIEACSRAIDLEPNMTTAYRRRATVYLCARRYAEACRDCDTAVARSERAFYWPRYQRAPILCILGRTEEAAADYREVRTQRAHASYADARLYLVLRHHARRLRQQGNVTEAERVRREAEKEFAAARRSATGNKWLIAICDCLAGERTADELVAGADPNSIEQVCESCYYAGEVCLLNNAPDEARTWFRRCVDTRLLLDPNNRLQPMSEYHLARWRLDQLASAGGTSSRPGE